MSRVLNKMGDRMLGVLVPKAKAAAVGCQCWGDCRGSCWLQCCWYGGAVAYLQDCCISSGCRTIGKC